MRLPPLKKNGGFFEPPEPVSDPHAPVTKKEMGHGLMVNYVSTVGAIGVASVIGAWGVFKVFTHEAQANTDAGIVLIQAVNDGRFKGVDKDVADIRAQMAEIKADTRATQSTVNDIAIRLGVRPTMPSTDGGK